MRNVKSNIIAVDNKPPLLETIFVSVVGVVFLTAGIVSLFNILITNWTNFALTWVILVIAIFAIFGVAFKGRKRSGSLKYNPLDETVQINNSKWIPISELTEYKSNLTESPFMKFLSRMVVKITIDKQTVSLTDNKALAFGNVGYSEAEFLIFQKINTANSFLPTDKKRYNLWVERVLEINNYNLKK